MYKINMILMTNFYCLLRPSQKLFLASQNLCSAIQWKSQNQVLVVFGKRICWQKCIINSHVYHGLPDKRMSILQYTPTYTTFSDECRVLYTISQWRSSPQPTVIVSIPFHNDRYSINRCLRRWMTLYKIFSFFKY